MQNELFRYVVSLARNWSMDWTVSHVGRPCRATSVMIVSYRYSVMMARSYSVLMAYVRQQAGDRWCT